MALLLLLLLLLQSVPPISPCSCVRAWTAAWEQSPAGFAGRSARDTQRDRIWWWCVQWCRSDRFAAVPPWLILWSHGGATGSERQRVRMKVMEKFREVRIFTAGQQMFAEHLSERVSYQREPRQIFLAHTDTRVQIRSALLILKSFLRDVMLKQSGVTGLKKKEELNQKLSHGNPSLSLWLQESWWWVTEEWCCPKTLNRNLITHQHKTTKLKHRERKTCHFSGRDASTNYVYVSITWALQLTVTSELRYWQRD